MRQGTLNVEILSRDYAWMDSGTADSLLQSSHFVATLQRRQNIQIGCPEEIALRSGWISSAQVEEVALRLKHSDYGEYLMRLLEAQGMSAAP